MLEEWLVELKFLHSQRVMTPSVEVSSFSKSNTDARGYGFVSGPRFKYFFLLCDPVWTIESLYKMKVYHYEWDVCDSQISNSAEWKVLVAIKFSKNVQNKKNENSIFQTNTMKKSENISKTWKFKILWCLTNTMKNMDIIKNVEKMTNWKMWILSKI